MRGHPVVYAGRARLNDAIGMDGAITENLDARRP